MAAVGEVRPAEVREVDEDEGADVGGGPQKDRSPGQPRLLGGDHQMVEEDGGLLLQCGALQLFRQDQQLLAAPVAAAPKRHPLGLHQGLVAAGGDVEMASPDVAAAAGADRHVHYSCPVVLQKSLPLRRRPRSLASSAGTRAVVAAVAVVAEPSALPEPEHVASAVLVEPAAGLAAHGGDDAVGKMHLSHLVQQVDRPPSHQFLPAGSVVAPAAAGRFALAPAAGLAASLGDRRGPAAAPAVRAAGLLVVASEHATVGAADEGAPQRHADAAAGGRAGDQALVLHGDAVVVLDEAAADGAGACRVFQGAEADPAATVQLAVAQLPGRAGQPPRLLRLRQTILPAVQAATPEEEPPLPEQPQVREFELHPSDQVLYKQQQAGLTRRWGVQFCSLREGKY